jgi:hypothetical protein
MSKAFTWFAGNDFERQVIWGAGFPSLITLHTLQHEQIEEAL